MEPQKKYELIVKIKELLIETDANSNDDFSDFAKISLNASKVLQLIYGFDDTDNVLKNFYEEKVNMHKKQKENKEQYQAYIDYWRKSLYEKTQIINLFYITDFLPYIFIGNNKKPFFYPMLCNAYELYAYEKHNVTSIFDYINSAIELCSYVEHSSEKSLSKLMKQADTNNLYKIITGKKQNIIDTLYEDLNYNTKLINTYEYFLLNELEKFSPYWNNIFDFNTSFYLFLAYRKVLQDMLQEAIKIDLSNAEKQTLEQLNENERIIKKLTPKEYEIFKIIRSNPNITVKEIGGKYNTVKQQVRSICKKLTDNVGGITEIKRYIAMRNL